MAEKIFSSLQVPYKDSVVDKLGMLSRVWTVFFRGMHANLSSLGVERYFQIENNVSSALPITGLTFNPETSSQAIIDFLIQRVTKNTGAVELIESGTLRVVYLPNSESWNLAVVKTSGPHDSGVDFSITSNGQVEYISSNITGSPFISRMVYRARTLTAKNAKYTSGAIL